MTQRKVALYEGWKVLMDTVYEGNRWLDCH